MVAPRSAASAAGRSAAVEIDRLITRRKGGLASLRSEPRRSERLERAFFRPSSRLVDLPYRAEMVGEMRDAAQHAPQFELGGFARGPQSVKPAFRLTAQ